jgi:hypothetical protein
MAYGLRDDAYLFLKITAAFPWVENLVSPQET